MCVDGSSVLYELGDSVESCQYRGVEGEESGGAPERPTHATLRSAYVWDLAQLLALLSTSAVP